MDVSAYELRSSYSLYGQRRLGSVDALFEDGVHPYPRLLLRQKLRRPLERLEDPTRLPHQRLVRRQLGTAPEDPADIERERIAPLLIDPRVDDLDWECQRRAYDSTTRRESR